ncbi:Uncharacterised protein [Mycobacteroides abscessus subsp. abscessus]|nr:Uncharacterised protein [Mycobacteroides abscessus subsp. abscessus]
MHFSCADTFGQLYEDLARRTGFQAQSSIELSIEVKDVGGKPRIPRTWSAAKQLRVQDEHSKYIAALGRGAERGIVGQPQVAAGPPDNAHERIRLPNRCPKAGPMF